eukprot:GHVR01047926.1.p1 GENE.GHVR01047926.1~~GHVR01047926.1.p1  ORF type:complete len:224 (+),score=67.17 GHVR01047926.1:88-759(+)
MSSVLMFLREKNSLRLLNPIIIENNNNDIIQENNNITEVVYPVCDTACWNHNGTILAIAQTGKLVSLITHKSWGSVKEYINKDEMIVSSLLNSDRRRVKFLSFSPLSTYIITCSNFYSIEAQKADGVEAPQQDKNLVVWHVSTLTQVACFSKRITEPKYQWPALKFTHDECLCLFPDHKDIIIFNASQLGGPPVLKISCDSVINLELSPNLDIKPHTHTHTHK